MTRAKGRLERRRGEATHKSSSSALDRKAAESLLTQLSRRAAGGQSARYRQLSDFLLGQTAVPRSKTSLADRVTEGSGADKAGQGSGLKSAIEFRSSGEKTQNESSCAVHQGCKPGVERKDGTKQSKECSKEKRERKKSQNPGRFSGKERGIKNVKCHKEQLS